ncbi:hypothetical protein D1AOALGA4SA_2261 [Olavius algarvensis Delta 1 endosymbiont]|nr:hypothetical protein D1AOALGA4SA_2261 [Olavius algarvensis Delta 1 endosymbiont]
MGLVMASMHDLISFQTLPLTIRCLIPLFLGIVVGSNFFIRIEAESIRHHVLILLIILSLAGLLRGIFI